MTTRTDGTVPEPGSSSQTALSSIEKPDSPRRASSRPLISWISPAFGCSRSSRSRNDGQPILWSLDLDDDSLGRVLDPARKAQRRGQPRDERAKAYPLYAAQDVQAHRLLRQVRHKRMDLAENLGPGQNELGAEILRWLARLPWTPNRITRRGSLPRFSAR